ncbi:unnamed protein product, partial [Ectocarpus fasciculatus]
EELRDRADLCAVDGRLYDLAAFAKVHPGGDVIQAAGGYDATALYYSMHLSQKPMKSELLQKYHVGTHARDDDKDPQYIFDSPFALDLQKTVRKAMGATSWYAPSAFWVRTFLICASTLLCEYLWITTGSAWAAVLVGLTHASIGLSVQHDASHGALSNSPTINALFSYGADWIGNSRWIWLQQHILWHHPHTNHAKLDPDTSSAEPLLVFSDYTVNNTGKKPLKPVLTSQNFITHLVLSLYGPSIVYNLAALFSLKHSDLVPDSVNNGPFMSKQKHLAMAFRLFYLCRISLAPWYFGGASVFAALFLVCLSTGAFLTFLFVVSHNFEGSDRNPLKLTSADKDKKSKAVCWYKAQVETSCSYGGTFAMVATGGLNYQIEHHLFPRLSSWYYPRIHNDIMQCCKRHGVAYKYYPSLWDNTLSMLAYMRKVGVTAVLAHAD